MKRLHFTPLVTVGDGAAGLRHSIVAHGVCGLGEQMYRYPQAELCRFPKGGTAAVRGDGLSASGSLCGVGFRCVPQFLLGVKWEKEPAAFEQRKFLCARGCSSAAEKAPPDLPGAQLTCSSPPQALWRVDPGREAQSPVVLERLSGRAEPAVPGVLPLPLLRLHVTRHHLRGAAGGGHQRPHSERTQSPRRAERPHADPCPDALLWVG